MVLARRILKMAGYSLLLALGSCSPIQANVATPRPVPVATSYVAPLNTPIPTPTAPRTVVPTPQPEEKTAPASIITVEPAASMTETATTTP
jgi:hypothetical protein